MKLTMAPRSKWIDPVTHPGELLIGNNVVKIENGDAIDHSMNDDDDPENYYHRQGYGKLQEGGYEQYEQYQQKPRPNKTISGGRESLSAPSQLNIKRREESARFTKQNNHSVSTRTSSVFMMNEGDCLDTTFDTMESYACKDRIGDIFPAGTRPPSPIFAYNKHEQQLYDGFESCDIEVSNDEEVGKNIHVIESSTANNDSDIFEQISNASNNSQDEDFSTQRRSRSRSGGGFGYMAGKVGGMLLRRDNRSFSKISVESGEDPETANDPTITANKSISTTLNTSDSDTMLSRSNIESTLYPDQAMAHDSQHQSQDQSSQRPLQEQQQQKFNSFSSRINRENSLIDVESEGCSGEDVVSTSPSSEKNKQDRLEQLRQNKRATEKERLSLRQSQTIVIPRSSLYGSEEEKEDIEEEKSCRSNNKLQLGSSISTKQTEQFYFRQKVALIATVFLISVGLIIMALALFWPSRIL